jgi:hypothetical protein
MGTADCGVMGNADWGAIKLLIGKQRRLLFGEL